MYHIKNSLSLRKILLFQIDSLLILASSYIAMAIKFHGYVPAPWATFLEEAIAVTILCQVIFFINKLYDTDTELGLNDILWRIVIAITISSAVLAGIYLLFPELSLSRGLFLYSMLISLVLICFWRVFFRWCMGLIPQKSIFILGDGQLARSIAQELLELKRPYANYHLQGILKNQPQQAQKGIGGLQVCDINSEQTRELIAEKKIDKLIVAISQRRENLPLDFLLNCKAQGIEVVDSVRFYEQLTGKLLLSELRPSKLIFSSGFREGGLYQLEKQVFDFVFAACILLIASPLMLLVAVLIKLDSPGPVLLRQERVGQNGKIFTLYKFRSMYFDAEEKTGPVWASENDPRVTRIGRIIRTLRLDELPQMINVLKGEMSIVGPRPERPFFTEKLQKDLPYYKQRLVVKPGITGWAAVKYKYTSSIESAREKLQYDLYYIKNRSFLLDMVILLKTIQVMITGEGSQ